MADADSFTTIAAVQSRCQRGAFSASTNPTNTDVDRFMKLRGAEVQAILLGAGITYTVDNGSNPFTAATTVEETLENLCSLANELLAAGDAIAAHDTTDGTGAPDEAVALWTEGREVFGKISDLLASSFDTANNRSHTETGGITETDWASDGFDEERTQSEGWGLGTKW